MIIKNHTIELNDTSASEMARFRQIMLKIWRQQIEDDKNAEIVIDSFKSSQIDTSTYFVPVFEVIECIKRKLELFTLICPLANLLMVLLEAHPIN